MQHFIFYNPLTKTHSRSSTLEDIKQKLWTCLNELSYLNQFDFKSPDDYILVSISNQSEKLEFYDKNIKLSQLNLLHAFFKLVQLDSINLEEKVLNVELSRAIGFNLDDLNFVKDTEILNFRMELYKIVLGRLEHEIADLDLNDSSNLNFQFKSINYPNLEIDPTESLDPKEMDESLKKSLYDENNTYLVNMYKRQKSYHTDSILINVFDMEQSDSRPICLEISLDSTLNDILAEVYKMKFHNDVDEDDFRRKHDELLNKFVKTHVLNVCGCDEIIYSNLHRIGSYKVKILK